VDRYRLTGRASEIVLGLLTPCEVDASTPGKIVLSEASLPGERRTGSGVVIYDAPKFALTTERVAITDTRLGGVWGEGLTRLVFTVQNPALEGTWTFSVRALSDSG
jgi:hypothetical protein